MKSFFFDADDKLTYKRIALALIFFVLITFLSYHPALNSGFIWDDDQYVEENDNLRSLEGLKDIWVKPLSIPQWYPLTHTTFWIEFQLWELNPFGYHFNNILLHALNAFLLWIILLHLGIPGAALAAAVFALHPVHTESVAWITERKNVLSGFFYLASLYSYMKFSNALSAKNDEYGKDKENSDVYFSWRGYAISILLFTCALLSKTIVATLPAVILVLIWWKKGTIQKREILFLIPFFLLSIGFGGTTAWLETFHVGAQGQEFEITLIERFLIAGRALWFYLYKLIWPKELMFIYPRWQIDVTLWWQYIYPLSFLFIIGCLYFFRNHIGRGPLAAVLIFAGTLFPALGFLNVYPHRFSFVADHFQYLASISIIASLCYLIIRISIEFFSSERRKRVFNVIAALLLINLGLKTAFLSFSYADVITLWKDTIDRNEKCWLAYNNIASAYLRRMEFDKACFYALQAINIKPDYDLAHLSLARAYYFRKEYTSALPHFFRALYLFKENNSRFEYFRWHEPFIYHNMGIIYLNLKNYFLSEYYLSKAIALKPDLWIFNQALGVLRYHQNNLPDSKNYFKKAIQQKPDDHISHYNLGNVLFDLGDYNQAVFHYQRVLDVQKDNEEAKAKLKEAKRAIIGKVKSVF